MFSGKDWDDFCEYRFKSQRLRHLPDHQTDQEKFDDQQSYKSIQHKKENKSEQSVYFLK